MKVIIILIGILVTLALLGWLGLRIKPKPFPAYTGKTPPIKRIPLPQRLCQRRWSASTAKSMAKMCR